MKGATVRPATVPALLLCAVLMTSAGAVRAGGEPVVPFPGAESDGEGRTVETPPPSGADAAGHAAGTSAPGAVARDESGAASGEPATPATGSRLLRALIEATAPEAAAVPGEAGRPGTLRVYAAEGCPRGLLRRLLAGAADDSGALTALGIEREILTLCRERQEVVAALFETEARLRELRAPPVTAPAAPSAGATQTPASAPASAPAAREAAPVRPAQVSPLRAALAGPAPAGAAEKETEAAARARDTRAGDARAEDTLARDTGPGDRRAGEAQAARYAWFSIIGTAGALRAGISDGTGVWFVREGDALPGGANVTQIAGRPPAVHIREGGETGEEAPLPYRALRRGGP